MKKQYFFVITIIIIFCFLFSARCKSEYNIEKYTSEDSLYEINQNAYNLFSQALELWSSLDIKSYKITASYQSFSPLSGLWQVWIKDNKIIKIITNQSKIIEDRDILSKEPYRNFNMMFLFQLASLSYKYKPENLFLITATFDKNFGYVKMVSKMAINEDSPKDLNFKLEILDFIILK